MHDRTLIILKCSLSFYCFFDVHLKKCCSMLIMMTIMLQRPATEDTFSETYMTIPPLAQVMCTVRIAKALQVWRLHRTHSMRRSRVSTWSCCTTGEEKVTCIDVISNKKHTHTQTKRKEELKKIARGSWRVHREQEREQRKRGRGGRERIDGSERKPGYKRRGKGKREGVFTEKEHKVTELNRHSGFDIPSASDWPSPAPHEPSSGDTRWMDCSLSCPLTRALVTVIKQRCRDGKEWQREKLPWPANTTCLMTVKRCWAESYI